MNTLKNKCIEKWKRGFDVDDRIKTATGLFDDWYINIPDDYKELCRRIVINLDYVSRQYANSSLQNLHQKLHQYSNANDSNTIFVYIKSKDGLTNSSNDYWTEYKIINGLNKNICYENIEVIQEKQWPFIENIVYVDDYCGSGNSFINEIENHKDKFYQKKVYFITICIMKNTISKLNDYGCKNNIKIIPVFDFVQDKAFERNLFEDDIIAYKDLKALSHILKIPRDEHMGYGNTQALVAFYNNTPNNTLGIIRYDSGKHKSLFPRDNPDKPSWQKLNHGAKTRRNANYRNRLKGKKVNG